MLSKNNLRINICEENRPTAPRGFYLALAARRRLCDALSYGATKVDA
jgi:hypothetical protein